MSLSVSLVLEKLLGKSINRKKDRDYFGWRDNSESWSTPTLDRRNETSRAKKFDGARHAGLGHLEPRDEIRLGKLLRQEQPGHAPGDGVTQHVKNPIGERFCHVERLVSQCDI